MTYDYTCVDCGNIWTVEKSIKAPPPDECPACESTSIERKFESLFILYANRPPWTYNDSLKYKDCKFNDGPRTAIDPSKHGDIGSWNCPGKIVNQLPKTGGRISPPKGAS